MRIERLIFGDNQFFGVNHMSEEKARAQAIRFQDLGAVTAVLDHAIDEGVRSFMCTTHERIGEVCAHARAHPARYAGFSFMPCMPYAHKYANAVTEEGMLGALRRFLPAGSRLGAAMRGGAALARKDIEGITSLLVDAEMRMFAGLSTPVVFLQNVVTDLLLGLGMTDAFAVFARHVRRRYHAEPGFITMNLPRLLGALERAGVDNPLVCANINLAGFRMSGGIAAYQQALRERRCRVIAMSVFASGAIPAEQAIAWVCGQPNIAAIVFGASGRANIRATRELVERHWRQPGGAPAPAG